nr:unnamed protein product [Meloidogyne enterolobii]
MSPPPSKKARHFFIDNLLQKGDGDYVKHLGEETKITRKFNLTKLSTKFLITNIPPDPEGLLKGIFQECIDKTLETSHGHQLDPDQLGCTVSSQLLESDIWIPIREISPNTVDSILNQFLKVAQSKKQDQGMLWGEPFTVSVTAIDKKHLPTTRTIQGSGKDSSTNQHKIKQHNLIKIINSDNYCLFRSLSATFIFSTCSWPKWKFYDYMHSRLGMKKRLEHDTTFLMENVGAPPGQPTYAANEWVPKVVDYWNSRNDGLF